jgi:hypothetical protein
MESSGLARSPLWDWDRLSEQDRAGAWAELTDWVEHVLLDHYKLGDCLGAAWSKDPSLVATLVHLHEWDAVATKRGDRQSWEEALRAAARRWAGGLPLTA